MAGRPARSDTATTYNCATDPNGKNSCDGGTAPGSGGPYALATETETGAMPASEYASVSNWYAPAGSGGPPTFSVTNSLSSVDQDVRTTATSHAGQAGLGWTLRAPTAVTVDPS